MTLRDGMGAAAATSPPEGRTVALRGEGGATAGHGGVAHGAQGGPSVAGGGASSAGEPSPAPGIPPAGPPCGRAARRTARRGLGSRRARRPEAVAADRRAVARLDRRCRDAARRRPPAGPRGLPRLVHSARAGRVRRGAGRGAGRAGHVAASSRVRPGGRTGTGRHRFRHALPRRRRRHRDLRLPARTSGPAPRVGRRRCRVGARRPPAHAAARGRRRRRRSCSRPGPRRRLAPRRPGPRPPARRPAGRAAEAVGC
jgi:hypothetical protein